MSERAPEPSRSKIDDDGGDGTFRGFLIGYLGFSIEEVYIGERATLRGACGRHTMCWRTGGPAPPSGVGTSWPSSISPLDSVYVTGKYDPRFLPRAIPRIFPV